jgi:hypothetical protein
MSFEMKGLLAINMYGVYEYYRKLLKIYIFGFASESYDMFAVVRTVKDVLKRVLGKTKLTYDKLRNVLCETESYVNGRPLSTVTEDPEDLIPLTPAMFMHEMPGPNVSDLDMLDASGFRKLESDRKTVREGLKARFRREYLAQLVQPG